MGIALDGNNHVASYLDAEAPRPAASSIPAFRKALDLGIQLRLWVALCVTSLAAFVSHVLCAPGARDASNRSALSVIFFSTLALYNLDGSLDVSTHDLNGRPRRLIHILLTLASVCCLFALLPALPPIAAAVTTGGLLVCSFYAIPFRKEAFRKGIKFIPGMKAPFVGVSVASAVVWIVSLTSPRDVQFFPALILWSTLSFYCTANALLFDLPDLGEDETGAVPTLALSRGVSVVQQRARRFALLGMLSWTLALLVSKGWRGILSRFDEFIALSTLGGFLVFFSYKVNEKTSRSYVAWFVDGGLLLPAAVYSLLIAAGVTFR